MKFNDIKSNIKSDILSGFVVFLIAVPLCLGIALASGAPLLSGMVAGIIGGLIVGLVSKSPLSVSGPAAGLTAICLSGIQSLGSFELFLMATFLGGLFQIILSIIKAGSIAYYFPSNVIKGMLTAIGIIIILKQLPHLFGYDADPEGDITFIQPDGENSLSALFSILRYFHPGAMLIGVLTLALTFIWDKYKPIKLLPGALLAVVTGVVLNQLFIFSGMENLIIGKSHLVNLPVFSGIGDLVSKMTFPDFSGVFNKEVWIIALTISIVASIETLLTIEATDKIDPLKRFTPTNRELFAQGLGNITSGLLGGLPITSVIVRSSANLNSGAKSKMSTLIHGAFLLIGVLLFSTQLNNIPLAALAAILIATGYKLCNPTMLKQMFSKTKYQWLPYAVTVVAVVFTDLLTGVGIGLAISILGILIGNIKHSYLYGEKHINDKPIITILLAEEVSFLNKASIRLTLDKIEAGKTVILDATHTLYIDHDVLEIIREFQYIIAPSKNIKLILKGFKEVYAIENNDHHHQEEIPESIKQFDLAKSFKGTEEHVATTNIAQ